MIQRELLRRAFLGALALSVFLYMIKTELLKRDVGNLVLETELVKRPFATKLLEEMEKCMKTDTKSVCCESKIFNVRFDHIKYENCLQSGLAVFLHTTGPKGFECCEDATENPMDRVDTDVDDRLNVSNFVEQIADVKNDSMCFVLMEDFGGHEYHFFSLELRPKHSDEDLANEEFTHGFYVYSSWAGRFSLQWFVGYAKEPRSDIPQEEQKEGEIDDKKNKILKMNCGGMKFRETNNELYKCLKAFAMAFDQGDPEIYGDIDKLFFRFECKPLNKKFKSLV